MTNPGIRILDQHRQRAGGGGSAGTDFTEGIGRYTPDARDAVSKSRDEAAHCFRGADGMSEGFRRPLSNDRVGVGQRAHEMARHRGLVKIDGMAEAARRVGADRRIGRCEILDQLLEASGRPGADGWRVRRVHVPRRSGNRLGRRRWRSAHGRRR